MRSSRSLFVSGLRFSTWTFLIAWLAGSPPLRAQGAQLVEDIATGPAFSPGSYGSLPVRLGSRDFFGADDGFQGYELWSTDGTPAGTKRFADLCPGRCAGNPFLLTRAGDNLVFVAGNATFGGDSYWLWRSDGTPDGTYPLVDMQIPGFGLLLPLSYWAPFRGGIVFLVNERHRQAWGLWFSDGTRAGTHRIAPLPGRYDGGNLPINYLWPVVDDDPGIHSFTWRGALWSTDGTEAGTRPRSTPIVPCGDWARLGRLVVYGGEVERQNCEPWVSDGSPRGTHRLRDVVPGSEPSFPSEFVAAGNRVYFTAFDERGRRQLWKTDGTTHGTVPVRAAGAARGLGKAEIVAAAGSRLYFAADDGEHGTELWQTDGTPHSTHLVADLSPGRAATGFGIYGGRFHRGRLFFIAYLAGESHATLFAVEARTGNVLRLRDLGPGAVALQPVGSRVYFSGTLDGDLGEGLGITDGTVAGTRVFDLARPERSSNPRQLTAAKDGLVFTVDPEASGSEVWRSDGRAQGTEPLAGSPTSSFAAARLVRGAGGVFQYGPDGWFGWTDGRTANEVAPAHSIGFPVGFTNGDGLSIFLATRASGEDPGDGKVWVFTSDGTEEGTRAVVPASNRIPPLHGSFRVWTAPEEGGLRYLLQEFPDSFPDRLLPLSKTDGTVSGTHPLARISAPRSFEVRQVVTAGSKTFVRFDEQGPRGALWVSDGTAAGTRAVLEGPGEDRLSIGEELIAVGDRLFFSVESASLGRELWVSDGSPEGTLRVADLAPGTASSSPSDFAALGERLLFSADDGLHGRELWISDGTSEGTRRLEIYPGPRGSFPQAIRGVGDRAVFAADDGVHGLEVWTTDGTPEGTHLSADVLAGPLASSPRDFEAFGGDLYFNAGRPQEGYELWKLPLAGSALP